MQSGQAEQQEADTAVDQARHGGAGKSADGPTNTYALGEISHLNALL